MTEMLQEYCDSRGVRMQVDCETGIIRGVKILDLSSRNGRTYPTETLAQAVPLYENVKVNVNHPKGSPLAPRDYQDRLGTIRHVLVRPGEGLFADFYFNPKHALAEQLAWDAEHAPENVGFSHNVEARTLRRGDQVIVEAITRVQSVDLVADPATTRGLFEAAEDPEQMPESEFMPPRTPEMLQEQYPELIEEIRQQSAKEIERLRAELDRLTLRENQRQRQDLLHRLLCEYHLPDPDSTDPEAQAIVSPRFIALVLAAEDENAMRELVEERARLVQNLGGGKPATAYSSTEYSGGRNGTCGVLSAKPVSRGKNVGYGHPPADAKSFVEAIT